MAGSGPGWVGLWLMRQSSTAAGSSAVTSSCNSADRRSTRRVLAVERQQRETTAQGVGGLVVQSGEELLGDVVEGRRAVLGWPSTWSRRAAQGVLVAQHRVAPLGRRRVQDAAGAGGRGLRAVAPEDAGRDVLARSWGSGCRRRGGCLAQLQRRRGRCGFSDRPRVRATYRDCRDSAAGQDHVRRVDREACAEWMVVAYPSLQGRPSRRLSRCQLTHPTPTYLAASVLLDLRRIHVVWRSP